MRNDNYEENLWDFRGCAVYILRLSYESKQYARGIYSYKESE